MSEDGVTRRMAEYTPAPPVPPDWLLNVILVRRATGDPVVNDFVLVTALPSAGIHGTAYILYDTAYNGAYNYWDGANWKQFSLKFADAYIQVLLEKSDRLNVSLTLIDNLIARIDPADYITSGNAGGQSVSFPGLADILAYYSGLKAALVDEARALTGKTGGGHFKMRPRLVGGQGNGNKRPNAPWYGTGYWN
jgi:hypothetical protein